MSSLIISQGIGDLTLWVQAEAQETNAHFEEFKAKMKVVFMALAKRNQELAERLEVLESERRSESLKFRAEITSLNEQVAALRGMVSGKDRQLTDITKKSAADLKASAAERALAVQTAADNAKQAANAELTSLKAELASVKAQLKTATEKLSRTEVDLQCAKQCAKAIQTQGVSNLSQLEGNIKGTIDNLERAHKANPTFSAVIGRDLAKQLMEGIAKTVRNQLDYEKQQLQRM